MAVCLGLVNMLTEQHFVVLDMADIAEIGVDSEMSTKTVIFCQRVCRRKVLLYSRPT